MLIRVPAIVVIVHTVMCQSRVIAIVNADGKGIGDLEETISMSTNRQTKMVVEPVRRPWNLPDVHPIAGKETEIEEAGGDLIALVAIAVGHAPAVGVQAEMEISTTYLQCRKKMASVHGERHHYPVKLTNCLVAIDPARTTLAVTMKTENEIATLNAGTATANEFAMTATATVIEKDPRTVIALATGTEKEKETGNAPAETVPNPLLKATTPLATVLAVSNARTKAEGYLKHNSTLRRIQQRRKILTP